MKLSFIYQMTIWKNSTIHVTKFTCGWLFKIMTKNHTCYLGMQRKGGVLKRPHAKRFKAQALQFFCCENTYIFMFDNFTLFLKII